MQSPPVNPTPNDEPKGGCVTDVRHTLDAICAFLWACLKRNGGALFDYVRYASTAAVPGTYTSYLGTRGTWYLQHVPTSTYHSVRKCKERSCLLINKGTFLILRDSGMFHWRYLLIVLVPGTCHMHHKHDTPAFTLDPV